MLFLKNAVANFVDLDITSGHIVILIILQLIVQPYYKRLST